jgi:hypothetical protein
MSSSPIGGDTLSELHFLVLMGVMVVGLVVNALVDLYSRVEKIESKGSHGVSGKDANEAK